MNLYKVDGGIGKNIAFTALIASLVSRDGEIAIESAYPDVYVGIPGIAMIYNSGEPKDVTKFYKHFDTIYASDPYVGTFFKGDVHLLDAWSEQLGLDNPLAEHKYPILNNFEPDEKEKLRISDLIGSGKYLVIQISGGQSPYEFNDPNAKPQYEMNHMRVGRNMSRMDALYEKITKEFPDHKIVQFALPNEPHLKDAIQIPAHYRTWFWIFQNSDFFIGIDSMMAHAMAAFKKPGLVFWDMNNENQFGYNYAGRYDFRSSLPNGVSINEKLASEAVGSLKEYLDKNIEPTPTA